jgi:DNA excision repair protein ERCC-5
MNLNKQSLVALAMLLGGDYTEGVKGVGIVNAMELLEAFDVSENLERGLVEFKKWLDGFDPFIDGSSKMKRSEDDSTGAARKKERFHEQHKSARNRWVAPGNFPSKEVMKAYLDPVVDQSTDVFTWGSTFLQS